MDVAVLPNIVNVTSFLMKLQLLPVHEMMQMKHVFLQIIVLVDPVPIL